MRRTTAACAIRLALIGAVAAAALHAQPPAGHPEELRREHLDRDHGAPAAGAPEDDGPAPCVGGFAGPYPCDLVDLAAHLSLASIGGGSGNDVWGWTDPVTGVEYALMGRSNGTAFVDISDPENPVYVGNLPAHGGSSSSWRDIKVYADHAFIVSEAGGHGLQVFDLSELRDVVTPPATFAETAHYAGFGGAHNVVINEDTGFAYAVGADCSGGLHMIDIQDPLNPAFAGCFDADGYTHDAQCVSYAGPDPGYQGAEICFNSNEDTLTIADVTDKTNPVMVSRNPYTGARYTHQGWATEDHAYFLLGDEADETSNSHNTRTYVWDISDLDAPQVIGTYTGALPSIDHNQYVSGGCLYQANYTSGLRILSLDDVAAGNLSELAFFDIYTAGNGASFDGAWSVYPFFGSGIVVVSGIDEGLFVLRPRVCTPLLPVSFEEAICAGTDALFTISVEDVFTPPVAMSVGGNPAGTTAGFDPNPVNGPLPQDTALTIGSTAGVAPGSYPLVATGDDGATSFDVDLTLEVFDAVPGAPDLVLPADGALDVVLAPTYEWTAGSQGQEYTLEVDDDPAFGSIDYSQVVAGSTTHAQQTALLPETSYFWRVRTQNPCGAGGTSAVFSFTTRQIPPILLVDDDDNSPDVLGAYTAALDALGETYDVWDTGNSDDEPSFAEASPYGKIVWFTGDEFGGAAGPGAAGEAALASYLDAGGCLLLSGQDYHFDRGLTPFMQTYLGVASVTNDAGDYAAVSGVAGSIFEGLGPLPLAYAGLSDFSDILTPDATAALAMQGDNANGAAVQKRSSYFTSFLGFPLPAIADAGDRQAVLQRFLSRCAGESLIFADGFESGDTSAWN